MLCSRKMREKKKKKRAHRCAHENEKLFSMLYGKYIARVHARVSFICSNVPVSCSTCNFCCRAFANVALVWAYLYVLKHPTIQAH